MRPILASYTGRGRAVPFGCAGSPVARLVLGFAMEAPAFLRNEFKKRQWTRLLLLPLSVCPAPLDRLRVLHFALLSEVEKTVQPHGGGRVLLRVAPHALAVFAGQNSRHAVKERPGGALLELLEAGAPPLADD